MWFEICIQIPIHPIFLSLGTALHSWDKPWLVRKSGVGILCKVSCCFAVRHLIVLSHARIGQAGGKRTGMIFRDHKILQDCGKWPKLVPEL